MYFVSSVLLMRMNVPEEYRYCVCVCVCCVCVCVCVCACVTVISNCITGEQYQRF